MFWAACGLSCRIQELIGVYIMMEEYFMREMILKVSLPKLLLCNLKLILLIKSNRCSLFIK